MQWPWHSEFSSLCSKRSEIGEHSTSLLCVFAVSFPYVMDWKTAQVHGQAFLAAGNVTGSKKT